MFSLSQRQKLSNLNVIVPPKVTQENHMSYLKNNKSALVHSTKKKVNQFFKLENKWSH